MFSGPWLVLFSISATHGAVYVVDSTQMSIIFRIIMAAESRHAVFAPFECSSWHLLLHFLRSTLHYFTIRLNGISWTSTFGLVDYEAFDETYSDVDCIGVTRRDSMTVSFPN